MAWYWWVLVGSTTLLGLNLLSGHVAVRRHDRFWATNPLPVLTEVYHARWTGDGRGARFYLASTDHVEWRYDPGVEPDYANMLQAEIELTALELRLGRPMSFPRCEAAALELNQRRTVEPGEKP